MAIISNHYSSAVFTELLLPPDEEGMPLRARELGRWCHGFVTGLALGGITSKELDEEECEDALERFQEIAEISYDDIEIDEEDEIAYTEVSEYVRMAVLMIYSDIQASADRSGGQSNQTSKHLH